jgi:superoxide dismutase
MNNLRISRHYERYPKYFRDFSRELIKKVGKCQKCGTKDRKKLTTAHLDQDPQNNVRENLIVLCKSCHIQYDQPFHVFSMMTSKKTDNSHLQDKVNIRLDSLKNLNKDEIIILEAYAGDGIIWNEVQKQTDKKLNILRIDKKDGKKGIYLKGDNMKFISMFDFDRFDIIDLDAYGMPIHQLEVIFKKEFKGIVHCTLIQAGFGGLNKSMLKNLGYTESMIKKIPTLFNKNGREKVYEYLANKGIMLIKTIEIDRKTYLYFVT